MTLFVRATGLINGRGTKTLEPIDSKLDRSDFVGDITLPAKFGVIAPDSARAAN